MQKFLFFIKIELFLSNHSSIERVVLDFYCLNLFIRFCNTPVSIVRKRKMLTFVESSG